MITTTRTWGWILTWIIFLALLIPTEVPAYAQESDPATEWLAAMSPEERVGQLFVVTFVGRDPAPESDIARLILEDKVGGVVLLASNGNVVNQGDTPRDVLRLTDALQGLALSPEGTGAPLFIAVDHEGDGYPYTRITDGLTPLPNSMAIGATWQPELARRAGEIAGRELSALGINLLLGPVLDVLNVPRLSGRGDIGIRAFGGDPYWVGRMGRAYVEGVHQGSGGRVATTAKHFPGHGGSDRLPDDEVATVDKSLQELRRVELSPFFAVTDAGDEPLGVSDALMTSHIRYRGFQGNIRQFTRPISFDAESLPAILALPELDEWHRDGVLIADALGVLAVKRYFDPDLKTFRHKQIAKEAFLAGNDLLILAQYALTDDWAVQYRNMRETIAFFQDEYRTNPAFAERVDEAVTRILRLKMRLYPDFSASSVLRNADDLKALTDESALVSQVARQAITLIYPSREELSRRIDGPPRLGDDVLIFTDARQSRCFTPGCEPFPLIDPLALQETLLRLYGPDGEGRIEAAQVRSRTFAQLKAFLTHPPNGELSEEMGELADLLDGAEWIIFATLDPDPSRHPNSDALRLYLAQAADTYRNAHHVVLAYTAPYYLDTTEVNKLTAYYGVYSKVTPFIEASARALFGDWTPTGASPVSIEGISYDLVAQLEPDPDQPLSLTQLAPGETVPTVPVSLRVRTARVRDRNGHAVPDGTRTTFEARDVTSGQVLATHTTATAQGVAEGELELTVPGEVEIVAYCGDAKTASPLTLELLTPPTPPPTVTLTATATAPSTPRATSLPTSPTPTLVASPTPTPEPRVRGTWGAGPLELLGALGGLALALTAGYPWQGKRTADLTQRVRWGLVVWIGGLIGYLTFGFGLIRPEGWPGWPVGLALACAGGLAGGFIATRGKRPEP
jgi:beta-N-acetylhexosaminidase